MAAQIGHSTHWVPPGPQSEDPGFGQGSDWDKRWHWATVGQAASTQGELPWWDPFLNYGTPLLSEPESFLLHPAYLFAAADAGVASGLRSLYVFSCFLLIAGMMWLARRCSIPPVLGGVAALGLVISPEWTARLGTGHVMILGVCAWPAMLAALHHSTEDQSAAPATQPLLWAALAGGILGLASLGGGHYPVAFGIFLAILLIWTRHAPKASHLALLALFALPLATWESGRSLRPVLEITAGLILLLGAVRGVRKKEAALSLGGFGLGLAASNGTLLTLGAHRAADVGRIGFDTLRQPDWDAQPLSLLLQSEVGELESFLHFQHPIVWLLLIGGLVALFRKAPALATVGVAFLLLAWTVGRPLRIWTPLALSPGMMAADSQMRMQWLVLLLGPLGALGGLAWTTERLRAGPPRATAQAALAGLALFWGLQNHQPPDLGPPPAAQDVPQSLGRVSRVAEPQGVYSTSTLEASIVPEHYGDPDSVVFVRPEEAGDSIHWSSEGGALSPSDEGVHVDAVLDRWTLSGPPNTRVVLAQKDLPGWTCEGGVIDPDLEAIAEIDALLGQRQDRSPGGGNWWLSVRLGASGKTVCRWRPPGLRLGAAVQLTSGIALLGLLGWALRQRKPN